MGRRPELQEMLESICDYVYFQPPESVRMSYPCIRYELYDIDNKFADNKVYLQDRAYQLTVIDRDPDSGLVDTVSKIDGIRFNRFYRADNLNHTVFILYY